MARSFRRKLIIPGILMATILAPSYAFADTKAQTEKPNLKAVTDENYNVIKGPECDDNYVLMLYEKQVGDTKSQEEKCKQEKEQRDKEKQEHEEKERQRKEERRETESTQSTIIHKNVSNSSSSSANSNLLEVGKRYLGVPYVYGGTTPNGFDCSGFTQYVVKQATGIDISRTTNSQPYSGTMHQISLGEARPGDLVYDIGQHAGIFVEDKGSYILMLHSPQPGDVVKIGPYQRNVSIFRLN